MSFECVEIECIMAYISPCCATVTLPITATETGTVKAFIEFNGTAKQFNVPIVSGQRIVVPTAVFNENYTHMLVLFKLDNVTSTSYHIRTMLTTFTDCESGTASASVNYIVTASGSVITTSLLVGNTLVAIGTENGFKNTGFTVVGNTLTFTDGTTVSVGDTITFFFA